jgi:tetratricopeptide (TPR) repeat protein
MNLNKSILVIVTVLFYSSAFCEQNALGQNNANAAPWDEAKALFKNGDYVKGQNLLLSVLNDPNVQNRCRAQDVYARFYMDMVGNYDVAITSFAAIARSSLGQDDPVKISAVQELKKLANLKNQYASEDRMLRTLHSPEVSKPEQIQEQITLLKAVVDGKPGYYRLAEAYYHLGKHYIAVQDYRGAYLAMDRAGQIKPALNFYLPLSVSRDTAYYKWLRVTINTVCWNTIGAILLITGIVFYASRPWRWLKLKHLAAGVAIALLMIIVVGLSYTFFAGRLQPSIEKLIDGGAIPPYFIDNELKGPSEQILKNLAIYGLCGTGLLFAFSTGLGRLRQRWAAMLINAVFSIILFSCLATIFYMENCDQQSIFMPGGKKLPAAQYISGANCYVSVNMEPYLLTNPQAYPDLALSNVSDLHMNQWIRKHCKFSNNIKAVDANSD